MLGAIAAANEAGALTVGLVCNQGTPLEAAAEIPIVVTVGPEILAGSTRLNAGTAQKIVLNIISTAAMVQLGKTYGGLMVDLRATNGKLRDRAARIVAEIAGVSLERARATLEQCEWKPKTAAAVLLGDVDSETATSTLDRHHGRLRAALQELAPSAPARGAPLAVGVGPRRLGVAAAFVDGALVRGDLALEGDRIVEVGLAGRGSGLAIPALIDTQVNGYAGIDLLSAGSEELGELGEALLRDGVAAYLPTLITSSEETLLAALRRIASFSGQPRRGAAIAGVHLEGPFLSPEHAGTHPLEYLRAPDPRLLERLLEAGPVRRVTLAPELPGALELIELCAARGVAVSLGHSGASAAEAAEGFAAGATAVTHLFNAMAPISGRAPALAGAALATPGIGLQLIADGVHVSDELIRLSFAAGAGRCSLVSDAISAATLGDGDYALGSVAVQVRDGVARRADGRLAGSTARLCDGLARLGALALDRADSIAAVTERPARLLRAATAGRLERGGPADLLIVDEQLRLQRVLASGVELEPLTRAGR